jgi:hypothetical protein
MDTPANRADLPPIKHVITILHPRKTARTFPGVRRPAAG